MRTMLLPSCLNAKSVGETILQKNSAIAEEVRRTLVDLDEVEKELKKAAKAIDAATGLTGKYRVRLQSLCDKVPAPKMPPISERSANSEIA
jgi:hypothetical protein